MQPKKPGMFALNFSTVICLTVMEMSYFVVSFILSSLNMSLLGRQEVMHARLNFNQLVLSYLVNRGGKRGD